MKKSFAPFSLVLMLAFTVSAWAQVSIGLRPSLSMYGGYDDRLRAEISLMAGPANGRSRMEFDVGWGRRSQYEPVSTTIVNGDVITQLDASHKSWGSLMALYQWHHKVLWRLHYYAGLGAGTYFSDSGVDVLSANVQVGLELRLRIPLQITLDYRPMLDLLDGLAYYHSIGLAVRYQFRPPEPEPEPTFIKRWKKKLMGE